MLGSLILAGVGALCMSNPRRRRKARRSKSRRRNPERKWSFERAKSAFPHRFTMEHVPDWAKQSFQAQGGSSRAYPAPAYRTDREWYDSTVFPGEPGNRSRKFAQTSNQSWPLGKTLSAPYSRNPRRRRKARRAKSRRKNPGKKGYYTIAEIRAANKAAGNHYFDRGTMKFFRTTKVVAYHNHVIAVNHYPDGRQYINIASFNPSTGDVRKVSDASSIEDAKGRIDGGAFKSNPRRHKGRRRNPKGGKLNKKAYVLQAYYPGSGWDDVLEEDTKEDIRRQIKTYRDNDPNTPYRWVSRRYKEISTNPRRRRRSKRRAR